ncbi:MAG: hypothetical protein NTY35_15875 [Planctomycetota bacterium]|nr:hypothetical protein [Planctomycetota bacterium]
MRNILSAALVASCFVSSAVAAERPGSLLVFPCFDNGRGALTALTVTNTNSNTTSNGTLLAGTVDVEFVYINGTNCAEFNRTRRLTPRDTITVVTTLDNPNQVRGYAYVFAKSPTTGQAIKWDFLIGTETNVSLAFVGETEPWVFQAASALGTGASTDVDMDGLRDLNGSEYTKAPDRLYVPRFWGALAPLGSLTLISLSPAQFTTVVDFLVHNDNEETFSAQYSFRCWTKTPLLEISNVFSSEFLATTNNNPNEVYIGNIGTMATGVSAVPETGWFQFDGSIAYSTAGQIQDPAILAFYCDAVLGFLPIGSQIPYVTGERGNGDLLGQSIFPDTN